MNETIDKALAHDATHLAFEAAMRTLGPEHVDTTPTDAIEPIGWVALAQEGAPTSEAPFQMNFDSLRLYGETTLAQARRDAERARGLVLAAQEALEKTPEYAHLQDMGRAWAEANLAVGCLELVMRQRAMNRPERKIP
jgi:hypothetical protein